MPDNRSSHAARSRRAGMTLVELIVALALLGGALLALAMFTVRFAHASSLSQVQSTAIALADDRLERVKSYGSYAGIDSVFPGTETSIPGAPHFQRQTIVQHVGGTPSDSIDDYRAVTVIVTNPELTTPVRKTTFIAAF